MKENKKMVKYSHPSPDKNMFKGAPSENFGRARLLRANMTRSEQILWEKLKAKKLGHKFRRQHPIHLYIADFYCHKLKLVIELDGVYHQSPSQMKLDAERSKNLLEQGVKVIRFKDEEVITDIEIVVETIRENIESISKET